MYLANLKGSTGALRHTSGLRFSDFVSEAPVKGGGVQKLDRVHLHCGPELEIGQNELLSLQSGLRLSKMFKKWAKRFSKWAKNKYSSQRLPLLVTAVNPSS